MEQLQISLVPKYLFKFQNGNVVNHLYTLKTKNYAEYKQDFCTYAQRKIGY